MNLNSRLVISITSVFVLSLVSLFTSCAGYRLGNIPRADMKGVQTIYVPSVRNNTLEPGLPTLTTNAILRRFDNDGTYKSVRLRKADATLDVILTKFERKPIRREVGDTSFIREYRITLTAQATLTNLKTGTIIFKNRTVKGSTDYFFQSNMQEVERQSLPLAAEKLADSLVSMVTEGW
ncbi:MAG: LptE family protein [Verrucomicrobiota bacterium]